MTRLPDQRPLSPYMIGPYYRPQLTSVLSITSRLTGIFITVVMAPLVMVYLLSLAAGPEAFQALMGWLDSLPGRALAFASLFCLCYHGANGIRHLIWDSGRMLSLRAVYVSGYCMVAFALALFVLLTWLALG